MTQGQAGNPDRGASRRTARTARQQGVGSTPTPAAPATRGSKSEHDKAMELARRRNVTLKALTERAKSSDRKIGELESRIDDLLQGQQQAADEAQRASDAALTLNSEFLSLLASPELIEAEKYLEAKKDSK